MAEIEAYIKSASKEQQPILRELRAMIRKALPEADEAMSPNGFAVYTIGGEWAAGFATRKKGPMLYVMASGVLDQFDDRLGRLRSGRSCIDFKATKTMTMDDLRTLAKKMLAETARVMKKKS